MIDHVGLRTTRYEKMLAFYEATLAPLGYIKMMQFEGAAGLGKDGVPDLWIGTDDKGGSNIHLALPAADRATVDAFYAAAMANGGKDNGPPGIRPEYSETYYAAFVIDPDGNNLEVVCHTG